MKIYQYLEKSIETPSKAIATCWRVKAVHIKVPEDTAIVVLVGYKDIDAFLAGAIPLDEKVITINGIDQMQCYQPTFTEILGKILQNDLFSNAQLKTKEVE